MSTSILEYFYSLEKIYPSIHYEITTELPKLKPELFFDYKKHLIDPFQAITTNPDTDESCLNHLHEWYNSNNPEYELLSKLNPQIKMFKNIQPYRSLLLGMAKDLIIFQYTKTFPTPDIPKLLNNSNNTIKTNRIQKQYNINNRTKSSVYTQNFGKNNEASLSTRKQYLNGTINSRTLNTVKFDSDIISIIDNILIIINNTLNPDNLLYYKYLSIISIIYIHYLFI